MTKLYLLCGHNLISAPASTIHPGFVPEYVTCVKRKSENSCSLCCKIWWIFTQLGKGAMECAGCKSHLKYCRTNDFFLSRERVKIKRMEISSSVGNVLIAKDLA
ncbi:hypothetical protein NC653_031404 [Populus alba x Populus x berolinensis]|uniref:Uncharacterized protein n=1 Tax=Populus alba x Populus x berolinensis TaxID=444605 RepID=A0AAD6LYP5_9ROSI|nr:hypothetical protein NC653_031404 [Populus alba x Populus x berolinensis]